MCKPIVVLAVLLAATAAKTINRPATLLDIRKSNRASSAIYKATDQPAAELGQFPWQATLLIDDEYYCGGSVLSSRWVMTAGHCVNGFSTFRIGVGVLGRDEFTHEGIDSIVHPQYDAVNINHDVGLILTRTVMVFSDNVQPVALPWGLTGEEFVDTGVTVSGWGETHSGWTSPVLNWVELVTISNEECDESFPGMIQESVLCAGVDYDHSTCHGDSGSAMVRTSDKVQIGIVSFGHMLACSWDCVGFTRVTIFLDWIADSTGLIL